MDVNAFNFDAMKQAVGVDPFADNTKKYGSDDRFYKLAKDKDGNGAAIIRFLPDSEKGMIQQMYKINTTIVKNGKKRFVSEFSPTNIGAACPFQEKWQELWNSGVKEDVKDANGNITQYGSKTFGRGQKFISNIKIIKDPGNRDNEGKIFLFEMSGALKDKIQQAVSPTDQDRELGAQPKEMFNPLAGNSFKLACKKGSNGIITYDPSEVINEVTGIYGSVEEALTDIKENTHKLSDLMKPESFMTYEQLQDKMKWVTFTENDTVQPVAQVPDAGLTAQPAAQVQQVAEVNPVQTPVQPVAQPAPVAQPEPTPAPQAAPASNQSLDALLEGLV